METILTLEKLSKTYGRIKAVKELTFSIEKGNVYGILGPNGSGKSTTLGMVLQVVNPTSGKYFWFDGSVTTHQALKRVGAIIERPNFYPYMSAAQNLKLVCKIKEAPLEKIDEKLELVGLLERKNDKFSTFSLGMKQRLAIASALLNEPEILILDEPTNGLDPQGIHQIREIIKNIAVTGTTILLASHLLDEVEKVCTHVVVLHKGNKLYAGPVSGMVTTGVCLEVAAPNPDFLVKTLADLKEVEHFEPSEKGFKIYFNKETAPAAFSEILAKRGLYLSHLVERKQSLEEQFLDLVKNNDNAAKPPAI